MYIHRSLFLPSLNLSNTFTITLFTGHNQDLLQSFNPEWVHVFFHKIINIPNYNSLLYSPTEYPLSPRIGPIPCMATYHRFK